MKAFTIFYVVRHPVTLYISPRLWVIVSMHPEPQVVSVVVQR